MDGRYSSTRICSQGCGAIRRRKLMTKSLAGPPSFRVGHPLAGQRRPDPPSGQGARHLWVTGRVCLTWLPPRGLPPATANRCDDPRTGRAQIAPIRASTSRAHSIWRPRAKTQLQDACCRGAARRRASRMRSPRDARLCRQNNAPKCALNRHSPAASERRIRAPRRLLLLPQAPPRLLWLAGLHI